MKQLFISILLRVRGSEECIMAGGGSPPLYVLIVLTLKVIYGNRQQDCRSNHPNPNRLRMMNPKKTYTGALADEVLTAAFDNHRLHLLLHHRLVPPPPSSLVDVRRGT
jgi:hypothetical protein